VPDPGHSASSRPPGYRIRRVLGIGVASAMLLLASACRAPAPTRTRVAPPAAAAGATLYQLDAEASQVWLLLSADGPLARVGHSHVITSHGLQGRIWVHPQLERSGCELQLAAAALIVDDPKERALAGGEYAAPLDDDARAGTREHMLGDRQLDAAHYPLVLLRCAQLHDSAQGVTLDVIVTLRGREAPLSVPVQWQRSGQLLRASGEFSFRQSALGLEPYSALFGALRVGDEIHARFRIVARNL
jgi:polyisoprenoid-binding protein YceI